MVVEEEVYSTRFERGKEEKKNCVPKRTCTSNLRISRSVALPLSYTETQLRSPFVTRPVQSYNKQCLKRHTSEKNKTETRRI